MASGRGSSGRLVVVIVAGGLLALLGGVAILWGLGIIQVHPQSGFPGSTSSATNSVSSTIAVTSIANTPAPIYGQVQDQITSGPLGGTAAKVDVINPGALSKALETVTVSTTAKTFTAANFYTPGQQLLLHVYSTEGNGYYDGLFTITVPSQLTITGNNQVYSVGILALTNRIAATGASVFLYSPTGAPISSTTNINTAGPTNGGGTYTATTKTFQLKWSISLTSLSVGLGLPLPSLSSTFAQQTRVLVAWLGFNSTAVNAGQIQGAGWALISTQPSGWLVFWKQINPVQSTSVTYGQFNDQFTMDTSSIASSTKLGVVIWLQDLGLTTDSQIGVKDSAPTAVGAFSAYGLTSVLGNGYVQPTTTYIGVSSAHNNDPGEVAGIITTN